MVVEHRDGHHGSSIMRSIVGVFVLLVMFSACTKHTENNEHNYIDDEALVSGLIVNGGDLQSIYPESFVQSGSDAKKIADLYFENRNILMDNYEKIQITYDQTNDLWTVNYGFHGYYVGGDFHVKINGVNGEIISVEQDE